MFEDKNVPVLEITLLLVLFR